MYAGAVFVALGGLAALVMFRGEVPAALLGDEAHHPQCALDGPHPQPVMAQEGASG